MPNPAHLMTLTGTLTRVTKDGTPDRYGDPTEDTTSETVDCWLHQLSRDEQNGLSNAQGQTADLLLPADTDPTGLDRITVSGVMWEFIGPPLPVVNPRTGISSHVEATVRAVQ